MAWFSWQRLRVGQSTAGTARPRTVPQQRSLFEVPDDLAMMDSLPPAPTTLAPAETPQVNLRRIAATLDLLDIRYLSDGEESLSDPAAPVGDDFRLGLGTAGDAFDEQVDTAMFRLALGTDPV